MADDKNPERILDADLDDIAAGASSRFTKVDNSISPITTDADMKLTAGIEETATTESFSLNYERIKVDYKERK